MSVAPPTSARLPSLDILRGLTVIGMIIVNGASDLPFPVPVFLLHAHWAGFTLADTVFPGFLFMVGVSIAISMPRTTANDLTAAQVQRIAWRSLRLILIGLFLGNLWWLRELGDRDFRVCSVLERIGIVYCVCALLHLRYNTRTLISISVVLLLSYWGICVLPYPNGVVDLYTPGANFVSWVDRVVLGTHAHVKGPLGFDPEGLISSLPAVAHGLIGVLAGRWLLRDRVSGRGGVELMLAGGVAILIGGAWGVVFPIVKSLWSSSFVLVSCGLTAFLLGALHRWVDVRGKSILIEKICIVFGVNAMAAYIFHQVFGEIVGWAALHAVYRSVVPIVGAQLALIVPLGFFVFVVWWLMWLMQRSGWYLKI